MKVIKSYTSKDIQKALSQKRPPSSGLSLPSRLLEANDKKSLLDFLKDELKRPDVIKIIVDDENSLLNMMIP